MRIKVGKNLVTVAAVAMLLGGVLAACGSSDDSSGGGDGTSQQSAETVSIDVGTDTPVELTTGEMKIAVFLPALLNEATKAYKAGAEEFATENQLDVTYYDAGFDPTQQLNQAQTALQTGQFDAAVVLPVDPNNICQIFSQQMPEANVVVVDVVTPLCDAGLTQKPGQPETLWTPGTMSFVGSNNSIDFNVKWFEATAEANPGPQNVLLVLGYEGSGQTEIIERAAEIFTADNPDFKIVDTVYTDYTGPDAYSKVQSYLQASDEIDVIMSVYSPDVTRSIVNVVEELDYPEVEITEIGGSRYSYEQIRNGTVQLSLPYFLKADYAKALEALVQAQSGDQPPRFIDDSEVGSAGDPVVVTKENVDEMPEPAF